MGRNAKRSNCDFCKMNKGDLDRCGGFAACYFKRNRVDEVVENEDDLPEHIARARAIHRHAQKQAEYEAKRRLEAQPTKANDAALDREKLIEHIDAALDREKLIGDIDAVLDREKLLEDIDAALDREKLLEHIDAALDREKLIENGDDVLDGKNPAKQSDITDEDWIDKDTDGDGFGDFKDEEQAAVVVSSCGKFRSTDELLRAYNALEAEFTRRCQRLKELAREIERLRGFESDASRLSGLIDEVERLRGLETEVGSLRERAAEVDLLREKVAEANAIIAQASCRDVRSEAAKLLNDDDFVSEVVLTSPVVRVKIIEQYLKSLSSSPAARVMAGNMGKTVHVPIGKPKTLDEARRLAKVLLGEGTC